MTERPAGRDGFTVAIICALPLEAEAIHYMFDELFPNEYHKIAGDPNHYINGRIGKYNAVLVLLTSVGKAHAASAAASLKISYTNLRLALLVGICGGVPYANRDGDEVLLGDVIISNDLVRFDFGRRYPGGLFLHKASAQDRLGRSNKDLCSLLRSLQMDKCRSDLEKRAAELLCELQDAYNRLATSRRRPRGKYNYPGTAHDKLFEAHYRHQHRGNTIVCCNEAQTCELALTSLCEVCGCDEKYLVPREALIYKQELEGKGSANTQDPMIHIGPVASGDTVMKSGEDRDRVANQEKVLAFEMEGAGIWDEIPCIIIKGVSDYADSHKHKRWQDFAAAVAAASMKALLEALVQIEKPPTELQTLAQSRILQVAFMIEGQTRLGIQMPTSLLFIEALRFRFKDLGTRKIDRGECRLCGLAYRRVEESQTIQLSPNEPKQTANYKTKLEQRKASQGPPRSKPLAARDPGDEIGRYKHVQLVDVNFKFYRAEKGEQPLAQAFVKGAFRLDDLNHIAEEIAHIYGFSEPDSLAVATMAIREFSTTAETKQVPGVANRSTAADPSFRDLIATLPTFYERAEVEGRYSRLSPSTRQRLLSRQNQNGMIAPLDLAIV
ncbi:hypothetical protein FBEOM_5304 [Fusarium beomiforme]|uniref:Nucleoside phosphorylase domain-containing protein n=1 Tax=Fusarium beomiforme TaxID=44412 RepID=A0A9P5DX98_9HYPO|nr:hypothetical protein FBEOM_5304 [Fusarium beomiforme]